jgi:hypothetical protein
VGVQLAAVGSGESAEGIVVAPPSGLEQLALARAQHRASSTEAPSLGLDVCMVIVIVIRALAGIHRSRSRSVSEIPAARPYPALGAAHTAALQA